MGRSTLHPPWASVAGAGSGVLWSLMAFCPWHHLFVLLQFSLFFCGNYRRRHGWTYHICGQCRKKMYMLRHNHRDQFLTAIFPSAVPQQHVLLTPRPKSFFRRCEKIPSSVSIFGFFIFNEKGGVFQQWPWSFDRPTLPKIFLSFYRFEVGGEGPTPAPCWEGPDPPHGFLYIPGCGALTTSMHVHDIPRFLAVFSPHSLYHYGVLPSRSVGFCHVLFSLHFD